MTPFPFEPSVLSEGTIVGNISVDSAAMLLYDAKLTGHYGEGTFHQVRHVVIAHEGKEYLIYCQMHYRQEEVEAIHPGKTVIGFPRWDTPIPQLGNRSANYLVAEGFGTDWVDPRAFPEFSRAGYLHGVQYREPLLHKGNPVAIPLYCRCDGSYAVLEHMLIAEQEEAEVQHFFSVPEAFPLDDSDDHYLGEAVMLDIAISDPRFMDRPQDGWFSGIAGRVRAWKSGQDLLVLVYKI